MAKWYVEKNGWHVGMSGGYPIWVESEPTYTTRCHAAGCCQGQVAHHDPDCMGICMCPTDPCSACGGRGFTKDIPNTPKPDNAIIVKLAEELEEVMKEFGHRLNDGSLELEVAKEKAAEDSLNGSSL